MLVSIGNECRTIAATIRNIKAWLERHQQEVNADQHFRNELSFALESCLTTLQTLESSTAAFYPDGRKNVKKWKRIKTAVSDASLKHCRDELRWQVLAASILYASFDKVPDERRKETMQINVSHKIHHSSSKSTCSSTGSIIDVDLVSHKKSSPVFTQGVSSGGDTQKLNLAGFLPACVPSRETFLSVRGQKSTLILGCTALITVLVACVVVIFPRAIAFHKPSTIDPEYNSLDEGLFATASAGSSQELSKLLERGGDPHIRDPQNWTPLHFAAANGSKETVDLLLKYKDTNWHADDDITPLHLAAHYGHTSVVKQILKKRSGHDWNRERAADPQAIHKMKTPMGYRFEKQLETFMRRKTFTARELAAVYGHADTALAFRIQSGGDIRHALSCACMLGNVTMVEAILNHLKDRSYFQKPGSLDRQVPWFPAPPLHLAIMSGDRATADFLLPPAAKFDKRARDQSTNYLSGFFTGAYPPYSAPAHYAAMVGSTKILGLLERRNADLATLDHRSRTPLSYAVEHLNEAAVELLVKQRHPVRRGWLSGSRVSNTYLGPGHVWLDKSKKQAAIQNQRIAKALEDVGFRFNDR
ncbi:MAG: hypothetical protein LQ338_007661 [Usnochroma carphineum]|nr:MAG: hypothetical protein LQ338_007661 [Usnochroma carphineum]